jgi:hypothetical protein
VTGRGTFLRRRKFIVTGAIDSPRDRNSEVVVEGELVEEKEAKK